MLILSPSSQIDDVVASQFYDQNYKKPAVADKWIEYTTPEGSPYYFNMSTNETTWTKPSAPVAKVPVVTPSNAAHVAENHEQTQKKSVKTDVCS